MNTSIFLAQIIGVVALAKGIALFVKRDEIKDIINSFLNNRAMLILVSTLELIAGLAIVLHHNIWEGGYMLAITIIGWLMIIEGITFHILPSKSVAPFVRSFNNKTCYKIGMVFFLVIGIWFIKVGFFG